MPSDQDTLIPKPSPLHGTGASPTMTLRPLFPVRRTFDALAHFPRLELKSRGERKASATTRCFTSAAATSAINLLRMASLER